MKYKRVQELVDTIWEAAIFVEGLSCQDLKESHNYLLEDIENCVGNVNAEVFNSEVLEVYNLKELLANVNSQEDCDKLVEVLKAWCVFVKDIVDNRMQQANDIDERFVQLMDYTRYVKFDVIFENAKRRLMSLTPHQIKMINVQYQTYSYMWGMLDVENDVYDVLVERIHMLKEHREDFLWLYDRLGDYRSKLVLVNMLYNWVTFDPSCIRGMCENNYRDYYDLDLLHCDENEVVVDIGAYTGDSALDYIATYRKYKKIYCYEITPDTVETMKDNLKEYDNIEILNKGAGARAGKMFLQNERVDASSNGLNENGSGIEIEVVTIDEDIQEKVTLIKMDIEGAEQDALKGCIRHIQEERPKLLVCVYHNNRDIWEIPRMIMKMRDDYRFYLRSNGMQWSPAEIVLFAL